MSTIKEQILAGKEFTVRGSQSGTSFKFQLNEIKSSSAGNVMKVHRDAEGTFLFEDYEGLVHKVNEDSLEIFHTVMSRPVDVVVEYKDIEFR